MTATLAGTYKERHTHARSVSTHLPLSACRQLVYLSMCVSPSKQPETRRHAQTRLSPTRPSLTCRKRSCVMMSSNRAQYAFRTVQRQRRRGCNASGGPEVFKDGREVKDKSRESAKFDGRKRETARSLPHYTNGKSTTLMLPPDTAVVTRDALRAKGGRPANYRHRSIVTLKKRARLKLGGKKTRAKRC